MYPPLESVTILVIININTAVSEHVSPTRVCNYSGYFRITVNPIIQPAPSPCPLFRLGTDDPVVLSSGALWVIRLPYPLYD
jgi:hypothetical protein